MNGYPLEEYQERGFTIKIVRTREAFLPLHEVWDEALRLYPYSSLHLASGYLECMWKSYAEELDGLLIIIEKDGKVIALAPLTKTKYFYRSVGFKALGPLDFMRSGRSDCVVLQPDKERLDLLWSLTKKMDVDLWHLDRFPTDAPLSQYFVNLPRKNKLFESYQNYELAILETEISWDDFIASKSKNFRKNYRRILNGSEGFKQILVTNTKKEGAKFIDDMVTIIKQSWKEEAGSAITNDERRIDFLTRLIHHYEKSNDFVGALIYDGDKPIAFTFGIAFDNKLFAIETSYDQAYKDNSVGIASYAMIMKYAFDHPDLVICDMDTVKKNGEYKKRWATRIDQQVSGLVLNGGLGSAAIRMGSKMAALKHKLTVAREN